MCQSLTDTTRDFLVWLGILERTGARTVQPNTVTPDNFVFAPPSKIVDGLRAVPIDITLINAVLNFDGSTQTASGDATISYTVGPTPGNPIFDLRQTISQAWLDGAVFDINRLRHHDFGGGQFADLRVIESVQDAGSTHTLRVKYDVAIPVLEPGGSVELTFNWTAGPRLEFAFAMSDLRAARYLEAWIPANLIFDQFNINLEIQVAGTALPHIVITNGAVTDVVANHWRISFPSRFCALSPLLEVRASNTVTRADATVVLPVSGKTVNIEAWKQNSGTPVNLTTEIDNIKNFLTQNENDFGAYLHEQRFVVSFIDDGSGGMEYEGGTTTDIDSLKHETFHSWFARGIKPASQADGWWDEGFTRFHDEGASTTTPFDFSAEPVLMCSRDPWQRKTPGNSYDAGNRFWQGMAHLLGLPTFIGLMKELYEGNKGNPISTQMIEEFLLRRSGRPQVVDGFHRFVYGFSDASPVPDLWLKDNPTDTGADVSSGAFSDSPDLWIRNADDGGTTHQSPKFGQDNWFHARVRSKTGTSTAKHFVVAFQVRPSAGGDFVYPADFLPCVAAKAEFDLAPGAERLVKARWPQTQVPAATTSTSLLASVIAREDSPGTGRRVSEDNNLAQKNVTVVS